MIPCNLSKCVARGAKLHSVAYQHLIPVRRLSRQLHTYMQLMAAAPATHAHYCLRTLEADLEMADYILLRHGIIRRQSYDDTFDPIVGVDVESLVLGSTLYGES